MNYDGITYFHMENEMYFWKNEMTNIIKKMKFPHELKLNDLKKIQNKCINKDIKFDIYINKIYKFSVTVEQLKEILGD